MPELLTGFSIQRHECPTMSEGGARVLVVVPLPHAPRPVSEPSSTGPHCFDFDFQITDQGKQDVVLHPHPFPCRAVADVFFDFDLADCFSGACVDDLARLMIAEIKGIVGRNHCVSMNHESFGQWTSPENGSVVSVDAEQGVQHCILIRFVSDMPHRFENPPARDDRLLWHRLNFGSAINCVWKEPLTSWSLDCGLLSGPW